VQIDQESVMNTTRRQFVAASAATLPALLCVSEGEVNARGQGSADDLVLAQVDADVARAYEELADNPRRVDSLRSLETSLRFHAAYAAGSGLDDRIKTALRRQVRRRGRAQWLDDVLADPHHAHRRIEEIKKRHPRLQLDPRLSEFRPMKREDLEQALDQFEKAGTAPCLIGLADGMQKLREQVAAQRADHVVRASMQFGWSPCEQLAMTVSFLEFEVTFVCSLSVFDPVLAPVCGVLGLELASAQFLYWALCSWQ
jgi:hypothetical protein